MLCPEIVLLFSEIDMLCSEIVLLFSEIDAVCSEIDAVCSEIDAVCSEIHMLCSENNNNMNVWLLWAILPIDKILDRLRYFLRFLFLWKMPTGFELYNLCILKTGFKLVKIMGLDHWIFKAPYK